MPSDAHTPPPVERALPWYLLWVVGALVLSVSHFVDFRSGGRPASAVLAAAWLAWAFAWYARPAQVQFRAPAAQAVRTGPLRPGIPQALWRGATLGGAVLLLVGVALRVVEWVA